MHVGAERNWILFFTDIFKLQKRNVAKWQSLFLETASHEKNETYREKSQAKRTKQNTPLHPQEKSRPRKRKVKKCNIKPIGPDL